MIKSIKKTILFVLMLAITFYARANPQILAVESKTHVLNQSDFSGSKAIFKSLYVGTNLVVTMGEGLGGFITNGGNVIFNNIDALGYIKINGNYVLTNAPTTNGFATVYFVTNLVLITSNSLQNNINIAMTNYQGQLNSYSNSLYHSISNVIARLKACTKVDDIIAVLIAKENSDADKADKEEKAKKK